ncbi:phosphoribosylanthranilate isomerase [Stappia sp. ES.058]|uniref:phosphoribosylanthranilate isomerase n=1 Tax=Stappia sp. ES.058 TaxID=1881061 RepID=UPI00087ACCE2|nr:phosphoribosylanthranilate isomerase [Stappia sp. ES.058]SDU42122.1 phosphoribosylanthranilate isomerase [Stappia sp. ES.058]
MAHGLVKICGLSNDATLEAAIAAGAGMIGLVFFEKSPRHVSLETAARLADRARGRTEIVALTVNADDATIEAIMDRVRPDWLQLHGSETPERCVELKARYGVRIMKALGIREADDIATALPYVSHVDRLLFDAKPPKGADLPGGNGASFDWALLQGLDHGVPLMLSGGLDPRTVADAIRIGGIGDVDVSSGVERARGEKDEDLIHVFVAAARQGATDRPAGDRTLPG